jgi:hypothetical protein
MKNFFGTDGIRDRANSSKAKWKYSYATRNGSW